MKQNVKELAFGGYWEVNFWVMIQFPIEPVVYHYYRTDLKSSTFVKSRKLYINWSSHNEEPVCVAFGFEYFLFNLLIISEEGED